jgi:hypothetical protein
MGAEGLRNLPDDDLLVLIAAREPDALGVIYDRYIAPVWKVALLTYGTAETAEQAVYETFMNVWQYPFFDHAHPLRVRLFLQLQRPRNAPPISPIPPSPSARVST